MNKNIKKIDIKKIWKEHKKKIVYGTVALIGGTIVSVIGFRSMNGTTSSSKDLMKSINLFKVDELPIDKLPIGDILDKPWNEGNITNMIVNNVRIGDCGKFGEGLKSVLEGLTDDNNISIILGLDNIYKAK